MQRLNIDQLMAGDIDELSSSYENMEPVAMDDGPQFESRTAPQSPLSQMMAGNMTTTGISLPSETDIQGKRQLLDQALQKIIAERSKPFQGPSAVSQVRAGYNPFMTLGQRGEYFGKLKQAERDQALLDEQRAVAPLELEAKRQQLGHEFLVDDRRAYSEDMSRQMQFLMQYLSATNNAKPSFTPTEITNPDGTTQKVLIDKNNPENLRILGSPKKPAAPVSIMKQYDSLSVEAANFEGILPVIEELKNLSQTFPDITLAANVRADLDQATGGKIPGLFPGNEEASSNMNAYVSRASELVLNQADQMKGSLSNKDIDFLKGGSELLKLKPEDRLKRLDEIAYKLKRTYDSKKSRMQYYDDKYSLLDVSSASASADQPYIDALSEMNDDDLLEEYQQLKALEGQ